MRAAFPEITGFSSRKLKYMRAFAKAWPDGAIVQQRAAKLPWFHLCTLLDKLRARAARDWYLAEAVEHGWSRNVMAMQIKRRAPSRRLRARTGGGQRFAKLRQRRQIAVQLRHHRRALAYRRGHPLGRVGAHVADGEHAGDAGLQAGAGG